MNPRLTALGLAVALSLACVSVSISMPPEGPPPPPIPKMFTGDTEPILEPTGIEGLLAARSLGPNVYYHGDLWYRRAFRRWYQAFRWNGNWFLLNETPDFLDGIAIEKAPRPDLRDLERLEDLPELPPLPDFPGDPNRAVPL
jgi:hypothetical protein